MQKKLAVFDYHGTLLWVLPAHEIAFSNTVKEVYGVKGSMHDVYFAASTIQAVTMAIARVHGVPEQELKRKEHLILPTEEKHFARALEIKPPRVLPGVVELLELLSKSGFVLALYTGHSKKSIKIILKKTGLERFFPDRLIICASRPKPIADRKALLKDAIKKAEAMFGGFPKKSVFVFDDSGKGVQAGKDLGIVTVGVGTGPEPFEKIIKSKPTFLFKDFSSPEIVVETIGQQKHRKIGLPTRKKVQKKKNIKRNPRRIF